MKYLLLFSLLLGLSLCSCSSKNKMNTAVSQQKSTPIMEKRYLDKGFEKAIVIKTGLEAPCSYLIKLDNNTLLEPQNLDQTFQSDHLAVWVSYQRQKRKSSCNNAQPVRVTGIEKR